MAEENNYTYPTVDVTNLRSTYQMIKYEDLEYKKPGDTDILQSREHYGSQEQIESMETTILSGGVREALVVMKESTGYRVLEGNRRCYVTGRLLEAGHTTTPAGRALAVLKCEVKPSIHSAADEIFQEWLTLNPQAKEAEQTAIRNYVIQQVKLQLGQEALIRNTQRLNWSPVEVARQIQQQLDAGVEMSTLCKQFGLAENTIKTRLALLAKEAEMPEVLEAVDNKKISFTVGKLLGNVKDDIARKEILEKAKAPATGEEAKQLSSDEVKELIDTKHQTNIASGGEGIKAQDRKKKRAPRPPSGAAKKATRSPEEILEAIQKLSSIRAALQEGEDEESINGTLDLAIGIKTLQWVMDHKSQDKLENLILGDLD